MKRILLAIVALFTAAIVLAQNAPTMTVGDATLVNRLRVWSSPVKIHQVLGQNTGTDAIYIQICNTATATNGQTPVVSFLVGATNYYSVDFGSYGMDVNAAMVVASTNASTVGFAGTNAQITVVFQKKS